MRKYLYYCTLNELLFVFSLGRDSDWGGGRWEEGTGKGEFEIDKEMEAEAGRRDGERDGEILGQSERGGREGRYAER